MSEAKQLNGPEVGDLSRILQSAFTPDEFRRLLTARLNRDFWKDVPLNASYSTAVFEIVSAANRQGWIADFILAARAENPRHPGLYEFEQRSQLASVSKVDLDQTVERIIRQTDTFIDVNVWREQLGQIESRVCRVEISTRQGVTVYGTAFLVGPSIAMTNYHVVEVVLRGDNDGSVQEGYSAKASDVVLRFDYKQLGPKIINSGTTYRLASSWALDLSPDSPSGKLPPPDSLDYALLCLEGAPGNEPIAGGDSRGPKRGWLTPFPAYDFPSDSPLFILQHPQGTPLKLALDTDAVVGFNENRTRVRYRTNTEPGSSGSPCFNQDWELVAIHHSGDPNFDPAHRPEYNEGIPFGAIINRLRNRGVNSLLGTWRL